MKYFQTPDTKTDRHPVDLLAWSPVCSAVKYPPTVNFCQQKLGHIYNIFVKKTQKSLFMLVGAAHGRD